MHVYTGADEYQRFKEDTAKALSEGDVLMSPGAAAAVVGVSRQRLHQLTQDGVIEAWVYHEERRRLFGPFRKELTYMDVSMSDVLRWGLKSKRLDPDADLGSFTLALGKILATVKGEM